MLRRLLLLLLPNLYLLPHLFGYGLLHRSHMPIATLVGSGKYLKNLIPPNPDKILIEMSKSDSDLTILNMAKSELSDLQQLATHARGLFDAEESRKRDIRQRARTGFLGATSVTLVLSYVSRYSNQGETPDEFHTFMILFMGFNYILLVMAGIMSFASFRVKAGPLPPDDSVVPLEAIEGEHNRKVHFATIILSFRRALSKMRLENKSRVYYLNHSESILVAAMILSTIYLIIHATHIVWTSK
jgi:hypothetical protein